MPRIPTKWIVRGLHGLTTAMVVVLVLFLAGLSEQFHTSWDWTQSRQNSLSPRSAEIIENLSNPVKIVVAYSQRAEAIKPRIEKILDFYTKAKSDIEVDYFNSTLEPKRAEEMGIQQDLEIHLEYNDEKRIVKNINESEISNALLRLGHAKSVDALWLNWGTQISPLDSQDTHGKSVLKQSLKEDGIDLESISLLQMRALTENPPDLLVVPPAQADLLDREVQLIDEYILKGGNALILLEPGRVHNIDNVLKQYGVNVIDGVLIDGNGQFFLGSALFALVTNYPKHPVLERLEKLLAFPTAGALDYASLSDADGWKREFLLKTDGGVWLENSQMVEFNPDEGEELGVRNIALVLTRSADKIAQSGVLLGQTTPEAEEESSETLATENENTDESVGEDGPDTDTAEPIGEDGPDTGTAEPVDENGPDTGVVKEQRVIVVMDVDFISNQYIGNGSNLDFAKDAFSWLVGNEEVLKITREKPGDHILRLDTDQIRYFQIIFGIVIPVLLLAIGIGMAIYRRRLR